MEENNKAYNYAMFLLNIRLRTEGELRERLNAKRYSLNAIIDVIQQLKDQHYIDDQRFAEVFLENLKKYKYWGYYGIKKKMMEKKLPMSVIEDVLSAGLSEEEELGIAKKYFSKEKMVIRNQEEKAKVARKLAAKGFRGSVISKLVF